jgi:multidrug transporter EmrE-like cation transporter
VKWLILLTGIAANCAASVLVKIAVSPPWSFPSLDDPRAALTNWPFWSGLVLYGAAFLLYAAALARLPLSVAHPTLTAGAIAAVAVTSAVLFQEALAASPSSQ